MPHTYKNLYPHIYDFDNLYTAWRRARRGGKRKRLLGKWLQRYNRP